VVLSEREKSTGRLPAALHKLSVIMPAFNESANIYASIATTLMELDKLSCVYEVIVVDDGSSDDTYLEAQRARFKHRTTVRVIRSDQNYGKGHALACGARFASGDYVAFIDADLELHPRQIGNLLRALSHENADVCVGSKYHPCSTIEYPWLRRIYSLAYYLLVRALFRLPLRDTQTGIKLFKVEVLRSVLPHVFMHGFAFDIELLVLAHRFQYKLTDAAIALEKGRQSGRINILDVLFVGRDTLMIYYRLNVLCSYNACIKLFLSMRQRAASLNN